MQEKLENVNFYLSWRLKNFEKNSEIVFFKARISSKKMHSMIINSLSYGMLLCGSTRKENEFSLRVRQWVRRLAHAS